MKEATSYKRVSKAQWLAKALEVLESDGIEAVKITDLAKALGISRSGFYWHFKNRQDLLEQMLDYWLHEYTGVVSNDPQIQKLTADKRLLAVMKMIRKRNLTKFDLAINAWAKVDPHANLIVRKAINNRLEFVRAIFSELGFDGDFVEAIAFAIMGEAAIRGEALSLPHGKSKAILGHIIQPPVRS